MVDKMGFWAFHVDSLFWSILLGALFITIFRLGIPKSTDSAPSGLQNIVEMCIEFVNDRVSPSLLISNASDPSGSLLLFDSPTSYGTMKVSLNRREDGQWIGITPF